MVTARLDFEAMAAILRESYWKSLGEERGPWETASEKSKDGWRAVARKMYAAIVAEEIQ